MTPSTRKVCIFLTALILPSFLGFGQGRSGSTIQFPESFKLDPSLLNGMTLLSITPEITQEIGMKENPGVSCDPEIVGRLSGKYEDAKCVYLEIYHSSKEDESRDDAGVQVTEFNTAADVENALSSLNGQSNNAYLVTGRYLILVWSDDSRNSETQLASMTKYYKVKLKAEVYNAPEMTPVETTTMQETSVVPVSSDLEVDTVQTSAVEASEAIETVIEVTPAQDEAVPVQDKAAPEKPKKKTSGKGKRK